MTGFTKYFQAARRPHPMHVTEFAEHLPDDPYGTIARWPYDQLPLTLSGEFHDSLNTLQGDEAMVRGRIVRPFFNAEQSEVAISVGGISTSKILYLRTPDFAPFWQLIGMTVEVGCSLQPSSDPTGNSREGELTTVFGIQAPLRPGHAAGLARGRVLHTLDAEHSPESYGMDLDIGDDVLAVSWNPSRSLPIREAGVLRQDGLVAMSLKQVGDSPIQYQFQGGIAHSIEQF